MLVSYKLIYYNTRKHGSKTMIAPTIYFFVAGSGKMSTGQVKKISNMKKSLEKIENLNFWVEYPPEYVVFFVCSIVHQVEIILHLSSTSLTIWGIAHVYSRNGVGWATWQSWILKVRGFWEPAYFSLFSSVLTLQSWLVKNDAQYASGRWHTSISTAH